MKMLRDMNVSVGGRRDSTDPFVGVLASDISTVGALAAFLLNDIDAGYPNRLYSLEILTLPDAGTLYLNKASAGTFSGAPDGVYTGTMRVRKYDLGVGLISSTEGPYALTVGSVEIVPTVTGVTVSPAVVTLLPGATQQFVAVVDGLNSPPQDVIWTAEADVITADGLGTAPAATSADQGFLITATSDFDPSYTGHALMIVPALIIPGIPATFRLRTLRKKRMPILRLGTPQL